MLLEDRILKKWLLPFILSVLIAVDSMAQCIPVYKDSSMSVERRVTDLLGRMTLREKIAQLSHLHGYQLYNGQEVDYQKLRDAAGDISYGCIEGFNLTGENVRKAFHAIQKYMVEETRLGIPVFTVTESLHGSVHDGSTIFPQSVAVGSTFNLDLAYQMTKAIATELRSQGVIQTLSPGLDVVRDLRWGRVEESFGDNYALAYGGAIYSGGNLNINRTMFARNQSGSQGGAFYLASPGWRSHISDSYFVQNRATQGSSGSGGM